MGSGWIVEHQHIIIITIIITTNFIYYLIIIFIINKIVLLITYNIFLIIAADALHYYLLHLLGNVKNSLSSLRDQSTMDWLLLASRIKKNDDVLRL